MLVSLKFVVDLAFLELALVADLAVELQLFVLVALFEELQLVALV